MRAKIWSSLICGLVVLGLASYGYFKAAPDVENQIESRVQIEITPRYFDLGEVSFGAVVERTFEVKNLGSEPLKIKRVSTSCACTKAKIDKKEIGPGGNASLLVTYDSRVMGRTVIGKRIERFVYIRSNDSRNPQTEVAIYARVK